jgi:hypothetical protein
MIIALMESLKGGPDLMSRSQMSNSLKLSQREAQEHSILSLVVWIMELQLNRSDLSTLAIESSIKANLPNSIPNTLKKRGHVNLPIWVVRLVKERWLANTTFHVAFMDFELIREGKSITGFDTNWRTGEATKGGEWEPLKILKLWEHRDLIPWPNPISRDNKNTPQKNRSATDRLTTPTKFHRRIRAQPGQKDLFLTQTFIRNSKEDPKGPVKILGQSSRKTPSDGGIRRCGTAGLQNFLECPQILWAAWYEGEKVNHEVWAEKDQNSLPGSTELVSGSAMQENIHKMSSNFTDSLRKGKYVYWWKINSSNIEIKA